MSRIPGPHLAPAFAALLGLALAGQGPSRDVVTPADGSAHGAMRPAAGGSAQGTVRPAADNSILPSAGSTPSAAVFASATRAAGPQYGNPPYDARFVFSRVRYGANGGFGFRRGGSAWAHDYPRADQHIPRILEFLTSVDANTDATNVFDLDDPAIFRSPMLYISEPGFWTMSDAEADGLRRYIGKGGFLIFDDFEVRQIDNLIFQMNRVLPGFQLIELTPEHEIFDSFYKVENIYIPHPLVAVTPVYYGIFEDNDPDRRMIAIVNHNNDLAEYWEWSETGYFPVDITNEAYKIGINYIIYTLTH